MRAKNRSTANVRYRFDAENRLVVTRRDDVAGGLRTVRRIDGRVTTDRRNRLVYRVDAAHRGQGPHRINLDGTWALTRGHELKLTLHETQRLGRQTLYLKGALVEATESAVTFALRRFGQDGRRTTQRLSLSGRWQADRRNRLTFLAEKTDGSEDRLTLEGGWTVDRHHGLLYRYRRRATARRSAVERTVRFFGSWDIDRANRLRYRLDVSGDSAFDFRASLQSPSLRAREGRLVYQVGVGLSGGRARTQRITLFGRWKFHRDLSVSFEIPYAHGRWEAIRFEGTYLITARDELAVRLLGRRGRPIGVTVLLSRRLMDDTALFLRLRKAGEEIEALGGVRVRF